MTSKQSETPDHPSDQERSTKSWKTPEPADVICYAYLWADEASKGQEEGLKDRPAVVVVASEVKGDRLELLVAPVTHTEPPAETGVELPSSVKRHLGLDRQRSWIIATELNRFIWPGPDIRIVREQDSPYYGEIPEATFEVLRSAILDQHIASALRVSKRTE